MQLPETLNLWAVTAPGLEELARNELLLLGLAVTGSEPGGVSFQADIEGLTQALLQLRTVSRLTLRVAEFQARTFAELERHCCRIDWTPWLHPGAAIHLAITSRKSRLYHQDAVAERVLRTVAASVPGVHGVQGGAEADNLDQDPTLLPGVQRVFIRIWRDRVTISVDATGTLLHRRGWRQYSGKAPLRETLAAAMLMGAGWTGSLPLTDPFAGSGTLVIEAALLARRLAPGVARHFAMELWPGVDPALLSRARIRAREQELPGVEIPLLGYDRDVGAVKGAWENAERAGVAADLRFSRATIAMLPDDAGSGWLITNPPHGVRVGRGGNLRDLYATLGERFRQGRPGWDLAVLSADPRLTAQLRIPMEDIWQTVNGGIRVSLRAARGQAVVREASPG